jgi:serine/threonine protein kinase
MIGSREFLNAPMTPERYQQIDHIFQAALALEPQQRAAFLNDACSGDEILRKEVESLITSDEGGLSFIDQPAFEMAARVLASDEPGVATGERIDRYLIVSLLGSGGMGEVYLAHDEKLDRRIALKLLPAEFTTNDSRLRRFHQEARAASALNHPNILTIHELGEVGGRRFIATEFVEGETLRARLERGPLSLPETIDIAIQIADALAAAHKTGIVHRDIKPDNIMLRRDGYVKVLDFGLAKLTEDHELKLHVTEEVDISSGLVMGTVKYMSPEQARGQQVDPRSDIFSLGVVLYEMLTSHAPFRGETASEIIAAIVEKEPPPLTCVPDKMKRLVNRALRKKKGERYQSIQELLGDLKSFKEDMAASGGGDQTVSATTAGSRLSTSEAVAVSTGSTVGYVVSGIKRHKITAAFILASLAFIGVTLTFSLNRFSSKPRTPSRQIQLQNGTATFSSTRAEIASPDQAVDGILHSSNGWHIARVDASDGTTNETAVWETATDLSAGTLVFSMYFLHANPGHLLGRFRFSVTTDDRSTFADGLDAGGDVDANWIVLTNPTVSGTAGIGGMTFTTLPDNSVLAGGTTAAQGIYTVTYTTTISGITGIRLEAIEDPSLPGGNGPGLFPRSGNFFLTELQLNATTPTVFNIPDGREMNSACSWHG